MQEDSTLPAAELVQYVDEGSKEKPHKHKHKHNKRPTNSLETTDGLKEKRHHHKHNKSMEDSEIKMSMEDIPSTTLGEIEDIRIEIMETQDESSKGTS